MLEGRLNVRKIQSCTSAVTTPLEHEEWRRIDRCEGEHLLFGAAQDVARRRHLLEDGVHACEANSGLERGRFKLRDANDHLITAIPVQEARDMLAYRRQLARDLLQHAHVDLKATNPAALERGKLRIQTREVRALAWAISTGRRVPYHRKPRWVPWAAFGLLICGVIPGLVFIAWRQKQAAAYQHQLNALVARWKAAGHPEPQESFFRLYNA